MDQARHLLTVIGHREIGELADAIMRAVHRSAQLRPQPILTEAQRITRDEWLRRARWCVAHALEVKKAKRWPTERIADHLQGALIDWLDGKEVVLSDRAAWVGSGSERFEE